MTFDDDVFKTTLPPSPFDELREAVRSPVADINAARGHGLVHRSAIDQVATAAREALPDIRALSLPEICTLPEDAGLGLTSGIKNLDALQQWDPTREILKAVREHEGFERSIASSLGERTASLIPKLAVPGLGDSIKKLIESSREDAMRWGESYVEELVSLTRSLGLLDLGNATLQLSMQPALETMAWLRPTLSLVTSVATNTPSLDLGDYLELWEDAVEVERSHSADGKLAPGKIRVLIDLLFLILAILTYVDNKGIEVELVELQKAQTSIVKLLAEQDETSEALREELAENQRMLEQIAATAAQERQKVRFVKENLEVRVSPSLKAEVLLVIPKNSLVQAVEESDMWSRVRVVDYSSGELVEGWVAAEFLTKLQPLNSEPAQTDD